MDTGGQSCRHSDAFVYVLSGEAHYKFAEKSISVSKGDLLYLPEGGLTLNIELNYEVPMDNCYALLEAVEKYRHYK